MKSEHVHIESSDNGIELVVDDLEVFDFIEDVLLEHGLEYDGMREQNRNGKRWYVMHFGDDVAFKRVTEVLASIPPDEIDRIWRLNNTND